MSVVTGPVAVIRGPGIWGLNNGEPPPKHWAVILVVLLAGDCDLWGQRLAGLMDGLIPVGSPLRVGPNHKPRRRLFAHSDQPG